MNRLTELKQKTPSFSLRKRRSPQVSARELETKTRSRRVILLLLLLSTLFWAAGCENYYSSSPRATTVPGKFTEETQSTSLTTIDFIIAALDTGMAARIMSGRQVTGHFAPVSPPPGAPVSPAPTARYLTLVSSCGSMGVTSREDTKPLRLARRRHVSRLAIAGTSLIRLLKFLKIVLPLSIDGWFPPGGGLICFAKPWKCLRASSIAF